MNRGRMNRLVLFVAAMGIVAAACGDDGGGSTKPGSTGQVSLSTSTAANTTTTAVPKVGGTITMGMFSEQPPLVPEHLPDEE